MKITFLGTNGWYPTATGDTPCILIETKEHYIVLDAGNGIYKLDRYITENKPISLFISHFHIDHTSGLHTLAQFHFSQYSAAHSSMARKSDTSCLVQALVSASAGRAPPPPSSSAPASPASRASRKLAEQIPECSPGLAAV